MASCQNCGRAIGKLETPSVWKHRAVCAECYERLQRAAVIRQPPKAMLPQSVCPKCGSNQTQSVPMAYACGSSSGSTRGGGVVFAGGDIMPVPMMTKTKSQTDFAKSLAPPTPAKDNTGWTAVLLVVCLTFLVPIAVMINSSVGCWIVGVLAGLLICGAAFVIAMQLRRVRTYNRQVHPVAMAKWQNSWVCLQCGSRFYPPGIDHDESATARARGLAQTVTTER